MIRLSPIIASILIGFGHFLPADEALALKSGQILSIELQIRSLYTERQALAASVTEDKLLEMKEEIQSQPMIKDYEWHAFAKQLRAAETYEKDALSKERRLKQIDAGIVHLAKELDLLLN